MCAISLPKRSTPPTASQKGMCFGSWSVQVEKRLHRCEEQGSPGCVAPWSGNRTAPGNEVRAGKVDQKTPAPPCHTPSCRSPTIQPYGFQTGPRRPFCGWHTFRIRSGDAPGRGEQEEKNEGEEGSHVWRSEVEADHTTAQRRRSSYLALKRAPNTTLHFRPSLVFAL